ncbi:MAG: transglycosylase domain-containing protein [Candidatus Moranbacteria bacterium]|nr:transglycosylase domain-containing protein [Candidatus Moranbacteria bacterium]
MKKKTIKKNKSRFHYPKQVVLGIIDAGLVMLIAGICFVAWVYYSATPAASQLAERKISETSVLYDRSGEYALYKLYGEENRKIIAHNEIPDVVRNATIATEDANFYRHIGVDPLAILRAVKINFQNNGIRQGASTITQQLARSAFLTSERTMKRKFLEAVFALKIERHYSKDEILDQYLNQVPYGSNAYGIETASRTYFDKAAKDLTLDEAAFLAALPKAPSYYSPYSTHRGELAYRQKKILERISELELASKDDVNSALAVDTFSKVKPLVSPIVAPHFVFFVLEQLEKKYGKEFLQTGGLKIYTTLDYELQKMGEDVVVKGAEKNIARGATNAALVAVNPKDGDILAMIGSKDFYNKAIDGEVNIATTLQQPGSSFKPFAYATAFEKGYQPETKILDAPTNFGPDGSGRNYVPRNYDGKFHGLLSMREALAQSLNIPAIKTLYLAGIDSTIELAHRLGITTLNDRNRYGLSLVIGGGDVKLVDMVSAFSVFANDGVRNPSHSVIKIVDSKEKTIEQAEYNPIRVLDVQIARKIDSILSDNKARTPIFGPRSPLILADGRPVAAKTGTTQEFRDAWTVGFTPQIAVGVWAGNNDNRPMKAGSDGVFVAAPIWNEFMTKALANQPRETFIAYDTYQQNNDPTKIAEGDSSNQDVRMRITYYNNKTGKKISEERAKKTDPKKVDKRVEYIIVNDPSIIPPKNSVSVAMPSPNDPMYKNWTMQP